MFRIVMGGYEAISVSYPPKGFCCLIDGLGSHSGGAGVVKKVCPCTVGAAISRPAKETGMMYRVGANMYSARRAARAGTIRPYGDGDIFPVGVDPLIDPAVRRRSLVFAWARQYNAVFPHGPMRASAPTAAGSFFHSL